MIGLANNQAAVLDDTDARTGDPEDVASPRAHQ